MGVEQTRGHTADGSGLRGHSVGDIYPYIVVGVGEPVRWFITKAGDDRAFGYRGDIHGYSTVKKAFTVAKMFKESDELDTTHGDPLCYGV